jgi:type II secretory pathway component PulC
VIPLAEAPDEVRRLVLPLAISGAVHSNERSQRMVIANGQVLHEGDAWGSDAVVIDEIRPRSVVLRVRGQRVMLPL